jgi:hypothetical protein
MTGPCGMQWTGTTGHPPLSPNPARMIPEFSPRPGIRLTPPPRAPIWRSTCPEGGLLVTLPFVPTRWGSCHRLTLRIALLLGGVLLAVGCSSSCCWSEGEWKSEKLPEFEALPEHDPLRVVIDAPTVKALLDEVTRRQPKFHGTLPVPLYSRRMGSGCRAPAFGDCDPCKDYSLFSSCSMIRQGMSPCKGQASESDPRKLRWANEKCPADKPDCALLTKGLGFSLRAENANYEVALRGARLDLGDGRLRAHVDLGGLKANATTFVKLLDRCGQPTQLPLVKIPERCENVEVGVQNAAPVMIDAAFVIEWRDQELRGRLDGEVGLKLPPGGAYVKQACYKGSFLGYDIGDMAQRETVGALEREWARREGDARVKLQQWLAERLSRPLADAIPQKFKVPAAGGEVTFEPHLDKIAITSAAITVQAEAEVVVPYDLINKQLAALGKVLVSKKGEDPLWFSDIKAEFGPGGTLMLRAAYEYQWKRGAIKGGGKGNLAFAGRGALRGGTLQLGALQLIEVKPTDSGCFDDRMRHRVDAALKGEERYKLGIKLQAQLDGALEKLRGQRITRDGFAVELQPDSLTALPRFEATGVRLHLAGYLRPRLVPAAAAHADGRPGGTPGK